MYVCLNASISAVTTGLIHVKSDWVFSWKYRENQNWLKSDRKRPFTRRPKYVALYMATLNRHERFIYEWNCIRLLEWQRRHKHYANASHFYIICTLSVWLYLKGPTSKCSIIILKWVKEETREWTGFIWLKKGTGEALVSELQWHNCGCTNIHGILFNSW